MLSYFYMTIQIVIVEDTDYEIPFVTQFYPYACYCVLQSHDIFLSNLENK